MIKNNKTFICIILALTIIGLLKFNLLDQKETFKIKDSEKIDKIFITDMYGNNIILKKEENKWTVNELYNARKDAIERILLDVEKIEIKYPVSKKSIPTVTKEMSSTAVKFTFYNNKKILKSFYVGGPTLNYLGTYMKNAKSKYIHVTHIPDHNGYLTPRFNISLNQADLNEWRSRKIIKAEGKQIEYFLIDSILFDKKEMINKISIIECESFTKNEFDLKTIKESNKPEQEIYIKYRNYIKKETKIKLYKRYIKNKNGEKIIDQERMLGVIEDDIFIMQKYSLKKILTQNNL